jgi:hypothetical protein
MNCSSNLPLRLSLRPIQYSTNLNDNVFSSGKFRNIISHGFLPSHMCFYSASASNFDLLNFDLLNSVSASNFGLRSTKLVCEPFNMLGNLDNVGVTEAGCFSFANCFSDGSCLSPTLFFLLVEVFWWLSRSFGGCRIVFWWLSRSFGACRIALEPISLGSIRPARDVGVPSGSLSRRGNADLSAVRTREEMAP